MSGVLQPFSLMSFSYRQTIPGHFINRDRWVLTKREREIACVDCPFGSDRVWVWGLPMATDHAYIQRNVYSAEDTYVHSIG